MLSSDEKFIQYLVKEYSLSEILSELRGALNNEAHELSDLGLKERALICLEASDIIGDIEQTINE